MIKGGRGLAKAILLQRCLARYCRRHCGCTSLDRCCLEIAISLFCTTERYWRFVARTACCVVVVFRALLSLQNVKASARLVSNVRRISSFTHPLAMLKGLPCVLASSSVNTTMVHKELSMTFQSPGKVSRKAVVLGSIQEWSKSRVSRLEIKMRIFHAMEKSMGTSLCSS